MVQLYKDIFNGIQWHNLDIRLVGAENILVQLNKDIFDGIQWHKSQLGYSVGGGGRISYEFEIVFAITH